MDSWYVKSHKIIRCQFFKRGKKFLMLNQANIIPFYHSSGLSIHTHPYRWIANIKQYWQLSHEVILTVKPGKIWYNSKKKTKRESLALSAGILGLCAFWLGRKRKKKNKIMGQNHFLDTYYFNQTILLTFIDEIKITEHLK